MWKSPHRKEYIDMVRNGWSTEKIKSEAAMLGEKHSVTAIENFKKNFFIATDKEWKYFGKKFSEIDRFMDVPKEYVDLILLQKNRIERFLEAEDRVKIGLPETRHNLVLLKKLYEDFVQVKQMLGVIPNRTGNQTFVTKDTKTVVYNMLKDARKKIMSQKEETTKKVKVPVNSD